MGIIILHPPGSPLTFIHAKRPAQRGYVSPGQGLARAVLEDTATGRGSPVSLGWGNAHGFPHSWKDPLQLQDGTQ